MKYIHSVEDFTLENNSAVTLGKFDGIHLGHQKLISIVKEKAKELGLFAVTFTFDSIPLSICPQKNQHFISTNSERRKFLEDIGIDVEIEYPFTEQFMNTEPEDFIKDIIVEKLRAKVVVVGHDFCFGRGRAGNVDLLRVRGKKYGYETIIVKKERFQDRDISSTYVREELSLGHMETANVLLGRPYSVTGVVCPGKQFGRQMNIPTMNIYPPVSKLLPPKGVYVSVTTIDKKDYYGVTNIGTKPTVSDDFIVNVETNLFDYSDDAYGKNIEVQLIHFIRPEMKFASVDALKKQMEKDAQFAKSMFML